MERDAPSRPHSGGAASRERTELDVLHCLEQSVTLLDHMLAREMRAAGDLSADEWRAIAKNLSLVSAVLRYLGEKLIPALLAGRRGAVPLRQQATWEMLGRLCNQTTELQLRFRAAKPTLN